MRNVFLCKPVSAYLLCTTAMLVVAASAGCAPGPDVEEEAAPDELQQVEQRQSVAASPEPIFGDITLWPGGVVPYDFLFSTSSGEGQEAKVILEMAFANWEVATDGLIDFQRCDSSNSIADPAIADCPEVWYRIAWNTATEEKKSSAASSLGYLSPDNADQAVPKMRLSKKSYLNKRVTPPVPYLDARGVPWDLILLMHEAGHGLGLVHEHQRADRDASIQRVIPRTLWNQQGVLSRTTDIPLLQPYDMTSVMHYNSHAIFTLDLIKKYSPLDASDPSRWADPIFWDTDAELDGEVGSRYFSYRDWDGDSMPETCDFCRVTVSTRGDLTNGLPWNSTGQYNTSEAIVVVGDYRGRLAIDFLYLTKADGGEVVTSLQYFDKVDYVWMPGQRGPQTRFKVGVARPTFVDMEGHVASRSMIAQSDVSRLRQYYAKQNNPGWGFFYSPQQSQDANVRPGDLLSDEGDGVYMVGSPAVVSTSEDNFEVFVRGSNNHLYHQRFSRDGALATQWLDRGCCMGSEPSATLGEDGMIYVAFVGASSGRPMVTTFDQNALGGPWRYADPVRIAGGIRARTSTVHRGQGSSASLAGYEGLAIAYNPDGRLMLFGVNGSHQIVGTEATVDGRSMQWGAQAWAVHSQGRILGKPAAMVTDYGRLYLAGNFDNSVWVKASPSTQWYDKGGDIAPGTSPALANHGTYSYRLFIHNEDGMLSFKSSETGWRWENTGGLLEDSSSPAASAHQGGAGRIAVSGDHHYNASQEAVDRSGLWLRSF